MILVFLVFDSCFDKGGKIHIRFDSINRPLTMQLIMTINRDPSKPVIQCKTLQIYLKLRVGLYRVATNLKFSAGLYKFEDETPI